MRENPPDHLRILNTGNDPRLPPAALALAVRAKFREIAAGSAPGFTRNPGAETFLVVEDLATPDRLFEVHAIAARA